MSVSEKELAAVAVAPRVTASQLEDNVASEEYIQSGLLTICILTLQNGIKLVGESACAAKENFNEEIGRRLAREMANKKQWGMLGYELRTKLHMIESAKKPAGAILSFGSVKTYVGTKVIHAVPMSRADYNKLRKWDLPKDEDGSDAGYLVEYTDGSGSNLPGFSGYVSWSPRGVFEKSYSTGVEQPKETYKDRLFKEQEELNEKFDKLNAFLASPASVHLPAEDQDLLYMQRTWMEKYLQVLGSRVLRLTK